jgi:hypothetical protein
MFMVALKYATVCEIIFAGLVGTGGLWISIAYLCKTVQVHAVRAVELVKVE